MVSWVLLCVLGVGSVLGAEPYRGTYIGKLSTLEHDVTGKVYAVDNITVFVEGFTYDGEAPDAFFFAGNRTPQPTNRGFIIPDERGRNEVLGPYRNKNLVLRFPVTKKGQRSLNDVKWLSVWCRKFSIDFGHVVIPSTLSLPSPQSAEGLRSDKPVLTSPQVTILDTETFLVQDFTFDGTVQDAIFVMGSGNAQSSGSQVSDEKGSQEPLSKYSKKSLYLTIPREVRNQPIQYFGVWSPSKGMLSSVTFDPNALIPPSINSLPK
ncbi:protein Skeletor, isoforms B/C-like [Homarus americanus]|uniref:protein Skeletor, isoforms B/C-like n=1 Tax=Homarus americanus TaxID=6706 RepID=UPI001C45DFEE|nr:protein Skeletor, isoforms B/C-like [Homarus americanus]